jgi:multiple sugar transport system substrate-binding protein
MTGKRRLAGTLALVVALCLFPAGRVAAGEAPVRVFSAWTHETMNDPAFSVLREAAEAFNHNQTVYRVELFPSINVGYEERLRSGAATGTLPCLLEFDGPYLPALAWRGYLQPIGRFVPRELMEDLLPSIITEGTYDDHLYSLGQFESGLGLWGNRRYLAAADIRIPTVEAPWSLEEFEQALQRLGALDGVEYALDLGIYIGVSEYYPYAYAPILQGFGGDLVDRGHYWSAKGVIDGPRSVVAMKHFQHWIEAGWSRAVVDRSDDFIRGKTALSWGGHWQYPKYVKALGKDLVLMPLPDFGQGIKTGMGSYSWGISSTCHDPAGAWAFLSYLLSPGEILRMSIANGAIPARRSVLARSPLYGGDGPLRIFAQQLSLRFGVPRPTTPAYPAIHSAFSKAMNAIIAGNDVQSELTKAAEAIDQDIAANHGYPAH